MYSHINTINGSPWPQLDPQKTVYLAFWAYNGGSGGVRSPKWGVRGVPGGGTPPLMGGPGGSGALKMVKMGVKTPKNGGLGGSGGGPGGSRGGYPPPKGGGRKKVKKMSKNGPHWTPNFISKNRTGDVEG
jgi:hypothetical protein